jgi:hypothetical protein
MSDLAIFSGSSVAVPSHIASFLGAVEENIVERPRTPSLNYAGKKWTVILPDGSKTVLTRTNDDGDIEPVQTLRVVIADYCKSRGRTYYAGAYDPDKTGAPDCWSEDGVRPDQSVSSPQHSTCAQCPMSVKGSRITESGKQVKACSEHRNVAVIPLIGSNALPPLKLKLSITSLFDKQSPDLEQQGWRAFENYLDFLRGNGVKHTAAIVTKMRFDPNTDYPKVIFSAERWLEPDEVALVQKYMTDGSVASVLKLDQPESPAVETPVALAKPEPIAATVPAPAPQPTKVTKVEPVVEAKPAKPAKPVKPAPEPVIEAKAEPAEADIPDDLKALLDDWDE